MSHRTDFLFGTAIVALSVVAIGSPPLVAQDFDGEPDVIRLSNRSFVPQPGIDPELLRMVAEIERTSVQAIVQLFETPGPGERARLGEVGIHLGGFLGGSTYFADVSSKADLDAVGNLVRWAGPMLPQDKVQGQLWRGEIEDWARTDDGLIKVMVSFQGEVDEETARRVLSRHAAVATPHGPSGEWAIEIDQDDLVKLAGEEPVQWLELGPLPMMPLLLGG